MRAYSIRAIRSGSCCLSDDGSTDGSTRAAQDYAASCPNKVFCFQHPDHENLGLPRSRNLGLQKARGRYVALLDADDVWLPGKLEEQVRILESHPEAAMVYGRSLYWNSWSGASVDTDFTPELGVPTNRLIPGQELLLRCYPLGKSPTPCPSDLLFRRVALEKVRAFEGWPQIGEIGSAYAGARKGIPFLGSVIRNLELPKTQAILYEDQALLAKIYLENSVYVADACWDKYRLRLLFSGRPQIRPIRPGPKVLLSVAR